MANAYMGFRECGWPAFLCVLVGLAGLAASMIGMLLLVTKAKRIAMIVGLVAMLLGLGAVATGVLGRQIGLAKMEEALAFSEGEIEPALRDRIRVEGSREAGQCVTVGAVSGTLPLLFGLFAAGIGFLVRKKAQEGQGG